MILSSLLLFNLNAQEEAKPNILFISVDDQNDWIEPLGGILRSKSTRK